MEITKQNETYSLSDVTVEGWTMTGSANKSVEGEISLNFNVTKTGELAEMVGDYNYMKPASNDKININCNVSEADRDSFMTYADTVIDTVLAKFAN